MTRTDADYNRGVAATLLLLTALLVLALGAGSAEAGKGGKSTPKLGVKAPSQAKLLDGGKVTVTIKSKRKAKVKVDVALKQDGTKAKLTKSKKVKVKPRKKAKVKLPVRADAERLVQSCIDTTVVATGKGKGKKATDKAKLKRDPARCDGETPVGVDLPGPTTAT